MCANALLIFLVMRGTVLVIASDTCEDGVCAQVDTLADDTSAMQAFSKFVDRKERESEASIGQHDKVDQFEQKSKIVTGPPLAKFKARLMEIRNQRLHDKLMGREPEVDDDTDWSKIDIERTEDTPDDIDTEDAKAELKALGELTADEVKEACPEHHYWAGLKEDEATGDVVSVCKGCAANCALCGSDLMSECSKCVDPFALLMVREEPAPSFACVEKCPECYTNEDGVCSLDIDCERTAGADVEVPLQAELASAPPDELDDSEGEASLEQQADGDAVLGEMKDQTHEKGTWGLRRRRAVGNRNARRRSVKAHRRRRSSRRRSSSGEDHDNETQKEQVCTDKINVIQAELTGWYDDCYMKWNVPKRACDGKNDLQRKTNEFKTLAQRIKTVTSSPTQIFLQGISGLPIIGSIARKLKTAVKFVNNISAKAETKAVQFSNQVKRLDAPCNKVQQIHGWIYNAVHTAQEKINTFSENCGCHCLLNLPQVNQALATSATYRTRCQNLLSFNLNLPAVHFPSLPNWLDSILQFISDIVKALGDILNRRHCIQFFWHRTCWSWGDILRWVGWLVGIISWAIESIVFGIINGILRALGLPTLDDLLWRLMNLLPLNVSWPSLNIPGIPSWSGITLPFDFGALGCVDMSCVSNELWQKVMDSWFWR